MTAPSVGGHSQEVLRVLGAILTELKGIREALGSSGPSAAPARNRGPRATGESGYARPLGGDIASDRDLDGARGNPTIKKDPKRWKGASRVGYHFSECEPEYLDEVAAFNDWKADNPMAGKETYANYDRLDAARARGWAQRIRNGWAPDASDSEPTDQGVGAETDDNIPF